MAADENYQASHEDSQAPKKRFIIAAGVAIAVIIIAGYYILNSHANQVAYAPNLSAAAKGLVFNGFNFSFSGKDSVNEYCLSKNLTEQASCFEAAGLAYSDANLCSSLSSNFSKQCYLTLAVLLNQTRLCAKSVDEVSCKSEIQGVVPGTITQPSSSESSKQGLFSLFKSCYSLPSRQKTECISGLAGKQITSTYLECNVLSGDEQASCLALYGFASKNLTLALSGCIGFTGWQDQSDCILSATQSFSNSTLCMILNNEFAKNSCLYSLAVNFGTPSACSSYNESNRFNCYNLAFQKVAKEQGLSTCNAISNELEKFTCIQAAAIAYGDKTLCANTKFEKECQDFK